MSVETQGLPNEMVHEQLEWLLTYGVSEQNRINKLPLPFEDKHMLIGAVVLDMDASYHNQDSRVHIVGSRVLDLPDMSEALRADVSLEAGTGNSGMNILGPDEASGISIGFAANPVVSQLGNGAINARWVICHGLKTGETHTRINRVGNMETVEHIAYFAIEDAQLTLEDPFYAHDARRVRKSNEELYGDLDSVIYDAGLLLDAKLNGIQEVLVEHNFKSRKPHSQLEIISYLNACRILSPSQAFKADYALRRDGKAELFRLGDGFIPGVFSHFELTPQVVIIDQGDDWDYVPIHPGLAINAQLIDDGRLVPISLPLNQTIRLRQPTAQNAIA